ncbi:MAG: GNAT family N-acetyltransferase [Alphaproteobacteria bacterium]
MIARRATPADMAALATRAIAPTPGRHVLVADDGGTVAGAAIYGDQPFETDQLGIKTARLDVLRCWTDAAVLDPLVAAAWDDLKGSGVDLVSCRVSENDRAALDSLQGNGFRVVECLLTHGRPLDDAPRALPDGIERGGASNAEACAEIARRAFAYDRFHADPRIPDAAADRLKGQWMRNACAGRADAVLVALEGGRVVGFNACLLAGDRAVIDLIAVAETAQGRGWGRKLVDGALACYAGKAAEMRVGTQSRNLASLALYRACGFAVVDTAMTLHAHLGKHA